MLNTNLSKGITSLSPNSKYKYFNVSPKKKVSILSRFIGGTIVTSFKDVYPPDPTFVCFSNASKICQPHSRYLHPKCDYQTLLNTIVNRVSYNDKITNRNDDSILWIFCNTVQDKQRFNSFRTQKIMTICMHDYYVIHVF